MTGNDKLRYARATIFAGLGAAAIAAIARNIKAKRERKKSLDAYSSKDAIVVPISKDSFMRDLPTPKALAESRGESGKSNTDAISYAGPAEPAVADVASMDADSIAAKKKEILRGRKFNFFGTKKASATNVQKPKDHEGEAGPDDGHDAKAVSEEKINGKTVLRGSDGKFVSPTDPVAVEYAEKDAAGMLDPVKDWAKYQWRSATGKPLAMAAAAVSSIALAEKITDLINERRKEKAKRREDSAREQYVKLLEGGENSTEKSAKDESGDDGWVGKAVGASFLIPAAITALVTNRIMENRRAEKKRKKELSSSYPSEPVILYQTYDGNNMKIAAETALMAMMIKRAMIENAEICECMEKNAQSEDRKYGDEEIGRAANWAVDRLLDENNRGHLLDLMKRYGNAGGGNIDFAQEFEDKFMPRSGWLNTPDTKGSGFSGAQMKELAADPRFLKAVVNSEKLHNGIVGNFESLDDWKKYRDEQTRKGISDYLSDTQNGWGLERGGILHRILSWIMNMFGAGRSDFYKQVGNRIRGIGQPKDPVNQETGKGKGSNFDAHGNMAIVDGGVKSPVAPTTAPQAQTPVTTPAAPQAQTKAAPTTAQAQVMPPQPKPVAPPAAPQPNPVVAAPSAANAPVATGSIPAFANIPSVVSNNTNYRAPDNAANATTVGRPSDFAPDFKGPNGEPDLDAMIEYLENEGDTQGIPRYAENKF